MSIALLVAICFQVAMETGDHYIQEHMYANAGSDLIHENDPIINEYVQSALF